jgi:hypothetical protein
MAFRPLVLRRVVDLAAFFLLTMLPAVVAQSKPSRSRKNAFSEARSLLARFQKPR